MSGDQVMYATQASGIEPHQKPVQSLCLQHNHNSSSVASGGCGKPFHLALSGGQHKRAQVLLERVHVALFET